MKEFFAMAPMSKAILLHLASRLIEPLSLRSKALALAEPCAYDGPAFAACSNGCSYLGKGRARADCAVTCLMESPGLKESLRKDLFSYIFLDFLSL